MSRSDRDAPENRQYILAPFGAPILHAAGHHRFCRVSAWLDSGTVVYRTPESRRRITGERSAYRNTAPRNRRVR